MTDSVNNSVHGTGIGKGGDYVENATANGFMPGIIKMTGGTISYPDAMKEFSSITHDPYLDNYNQNDITEGYKFAAKTHMLACGMKAASLWFDDNIDKIYKICINKTYHSNRGGK